MTNYDGLVISALVEAQSVSSERPQAGLCPLRGMRRAVLAQGSGARLAAAVGPGVSVLAVTEPAETAAAAAFAHTAVLAGRAGNFAALAEVGRLFGRVAHLLHAVEDLEVDAAVGAWNPLLATGTGLVEARRLCDDAALGITLALADADFTDQRLVHALLVHEVRHAITRTFTRADPPDSPPDCPGCPPPPPVLPESPPPSPRRRRRWLQLRLSTLLRCVVQLLT